MESQPLSDLPSSFYRGSASRWTDSETDCSTESGSSDEMDSDSGYGIGGGTSRTPSHCVARRGAGASDCRTTLPVYADDGTSAFPLSAAATGRMLLVPPRLWPPPPTSISRSNVTAVHVTPQTPPHLAPRDALTANVGVNTTVTSSGYQQTTTTQQTHLVVSLDCIHTLNRQAVPFSQTHMTRFTKALKNFVGCLQFFVRICIVFVNKGVNDFQRTSKLIFKCCLTT